MGAVQQNLGAQLDRYKLTAQLSPTQSPIRSMIKCSPPTEVEDSIRKQAAKLGVPLTQYLNPFLALIANGTLALTPQLTPVLPAPTR